MIQFDNIVQTNKIYLPREVGTVWVDMKRRTRARRNI